MSDLIITEDCIGCSSCCEVCPDVFVMDDDGERARVLDPQADDACVEEAVEICPVQAIVREG